MNATDILNKAAQHMADRASTYDKPEGERSMGRAVEAFNAITGRDLSEPEGWLLLQVLKDVRLFTRPGYHADSAEDCVAYAALKAEALTAADIDRGYAELLDKSSAVHQALKGAAESFLSVTHGEARHFDPDSLAKAEDFKGDWPDETRRQDAAAQDEAWQPRIDSGPMWVEWRGEGEAPPVAEDVMVEVRSRDGVTEIGLAGDFEWGHMWNDGCAHDIVAWRYPWPDDDRIDAIGQNCATGEHY